MKPLITDHEDTATLKNFKEAIKGLEVLILEDKSKRLTMWMDISIQAYMVYQETDTDPIMSDWVDIEAAYNIFISKYEPTI